jgi:hypothetical protein
MIQIRPSRDYDGRWRIAEKEGLFTSPKITPPTATPLIITSRDALKEHSLAFFIGWLFTGVLNRSKELLRVSLLPVGDKGETSVLVPPESGTIGVHQRHPRCQASWQTRHSGHAAASEDALGRPKTSFPDAKSGKLAASAIRAFIPGGL